MTIFLDEPDYVLGCLGFITAKRVRNFFIKVGIGLSASIALIDAALFLSHRSKPILIGQSVFLMLCAWTFVFCFLRLFVTAFMWLFDRICDFFSEIIPAFEDSIYSLKLYYWKCFDSFLSLGFLGMLIYAMLLPFGFVEPM
jgi:hypothetical protein